MSVAYQSNREWIAYGIEWRYVGDTDDDWRWYVRDSEYEGDCRITTSPYSFQRIDDAYKYMKKELRHDGRHEYQVVEFEYVRRKVV